MTKEEITSILRELESDLKKGEEEAMKEIAPPEAPEKEVSEDKAPATPAPEAPEKEVSEDKAPEMPEAPEAPEKEVSEDKAPEAPEKEVEMTPEALQVEYAQLSPEELDMHIQAALAAKQALAATAAPPAAAPAPAPDMPVQKSEDVIKLEALVKSQAEDIINLTKAVSMVLEAPVRKSITSISEIEDVKKSEAVKPMTRKEVDAFICDNATKMTKSERDLWLKFVDNQVPASKLVPMLERLSSK